MFTPYWGKIGHSGRPWIDKAARKDPPQRASNKQRALIKTLDEKNGFQLSAGELNGFTLREASVFTNAYFGEAEHRQSERQQVPPIWCARPRKAVQSGNHLAGQ
jgi:hypothetical protein